jgi:hypothetical protein
MSITTKNKAVQTIRYTDAQKKEVVDFVVNHNAANKSGGQSTAVTKFKISPITIASWLKAAGVSAPKVKAKAKKASKAKKAAQPKATPKVEAPPSIPEKTVASLPTKDVSTPSTKATPTKATPTKATPSKANAVIRYTPQQKAEVLAFVASHNAANIRGGQSTAATKFNISPITVMAWIKAAGAPKAETKDVKPAATAKTPANSNGINAKLTALLALSNQITKAETELAKLNAKFSSLKATL